MQLALEIEKEREKIQKGEEISGVGTVTSLADEQGIGSPMISAVAAPLNGADDVQPIEVAKKPEGEGDIRMEDA